MPPRSYDRCMADTAGGHVAALGRCGLVVSGSQGAGMFPEQFHPAG